MRFYRVEFLTEGSMFLLFLFTIRQIYDLSFEYRLLIKIG
jgi:hypothetical protein